MSYTWGVLDFEFYLGSNFLHRKIDNRLFAPDGMKRKASPGLTDKVPWSFHHSNAPMSYPRDYSATIITHWQNFRRWVQGKTGQEFVDTMMKELYFTGELSNRGRQCAASYLIHDLHIPWWWGAQWFEHLLVDYDVSSNWGNWAYIAGVGADPREVRRFNMVKQAKMYDPDGSYRRWGKKMQWYVPDEAVPVEFPGEFG